MRKIRGLRASARIRLRVKSRDWRNRASPSLYSIIRRGWTVANDSRQKREDSRESRRVFGDYLVVSRSRQLDAIRLRRVVI